MLCNPDFYMLLLNIKICKLWVNCDLTGELLGERAQEEAAMLMAGV